MLFCILGIHIANAWPKEALEAAKCPKPLDA